ncbi:aminotransferase class IV [Gulosibacter chungangensis]|uniref:Aminotransferase class IV n=1 Tax=Gulosibacter chungangensis TaxID=979746 RepID=A0A7J5BC27_9MICO|nr:aminotransferase class IV [Gulosibacter chungangensis]KAB1643108.1 aminotransferase class IV [Gulosibacter chungangensis]
MKAPETTTVMAAEMTVEYRWQGGQFVRFERAAAGEILVADSWRSEATRAAAFDYHVARFEDAVARVSQTRFDWPAIWRGVAALIAAEGAASLFPRISVETSSAPGEGADIATGTGTGTDMATDRGMGKSTGKGNPSGTLIDGALEPPLVLAIRPCPSAREFTSLTVYDGLDPRQSPQIKGPDIARLAAAKATVGTDDIILRDADGVVLEASTGALVHWLDRQIVLSNRFDRQLASVTQRQVYDRALELEIPVSFRAVRPEELGRGPLWFVNAVHGVSPVLEIHTADGPIAIPEHPQEAEWRDWWWTTLQPIDATVTSLQDRHRTHPALHD